MRRWAGGGALAARPSLSRSLIACSRRAILRKASALEYKIQRRALRKEDFVNYIQVGRAGEQSQLARVGGGSAVTPVGSRQLLVGSPPRRPSAHP